MIETRTGCKVIAELKPGSEITRFKHILIITHPDDPVKYIDMHDIDAGMRELSVVRADGDD